MPESSRNHCITAVVGTLIQISVALWVTAICVDLLTRAPSPADLEAAAEVATVGAVGEQPESIYRRTAYGYVIGTVAFAGSLGLIGLVCNFLIAVMGQYRARWFFWASLLCALMYTVVIPIGTLLAAAFLLYLVVKRRAFLSLPIPAPGATG